MAGPGVALPSLAAGTLVTVNTRNTCYRIQVVDGSARRVLVTGGALFPSSTEVEVIGAADEVGVRIGLMVEGLPLELSTPRGPILTSMVVSVSIGDASASVVAPGAPSANERDDQRDNRQQ